MKLKKLWVIIIGALVSVAVAAVVIITQGSHYTVHTTIGAQTEQQMKVQVIFDNEGIVGKENVRAENGELVVDVKALKQGQTNGTIRCIFNDTASVMEYPFSLEVKPFNIIVEHVPGVVNYTGHMAVVIAFISIIILITGIMLWSFFEDSRQGKFGYKMIIYGGIGFFLGVLSLFLVYKMLNNRLNDGLRFISEIENTGKIVLIVLSPVMLVLSVLLSVSNVQLIRKEGRRPVNALGIVFGILWFAAMAVSCGIYTIYSNWQWSVDAVRFIRNSLIYVIAYFECMFLSTVVTAIKATKYVPLYNRDYIIILGCGINRDGTLTPLLKSRADSAIRFECTQFNKSGQHAVFVPSGGQGADESISESEAISRYLQSQNIPEEQILKEDKSTTTFENMQFSKEVIEKNSGDITKKKIAFATTNYHILRGYILSKKNGFDAKGISAKTKFYFYPNAFLREFIGLLVDQKWKHLLMICLICAVFFGYSYMIR